MTTSAVQTERERQIRILSTNGKDESMAVVLNDNNNDNRHPPTYYEEHKPAMLEYSRNYYARNRKMILAKAKAYNAREENKQRRRKYSKQYWLANKERIARQQRHYRNNKREQDYKLMQVSNSRNP